MNNNLLYHPSNLDVGVVLTKYIEQLIKTLKILEIQEIELGNESKDLLNIHMEKPLKEHQPLDNN